MGGCQNYGPFLGTLNIRCRILIRTQIGTIILTTTHVGFRGPRAYGGCSRGLGNLVVWGVLGLWGVQGLWGLGGLGTSTGLLDVLAYPESPIALKERFSPKWC